MLVTRRIWIFSLVLAGNLFVSSADWNQWRGPNRDGKIESSAAPAQWPKELNRRWKVEVGEGHSSPIIVGDRVFIFTRQGDDEVARCLELATGKEVWRQSYPAPYEMNAYAKEHGKGPKSTPVCAEGRLYTFGISGILSCFDAKSGQVLWRHEFLKQFKLTSPIYGTAMSPLLDGDLLITHVGGHDAGALTAFDAKTGDVRWRWDGDGPSYASPIITTIGGVRQVVTQSQKLCVGVTVESGKLLWSIPFTTDYDQNIVTPIVVGDLVVFGGSEQPTVACRVRKVGDQWTTEKVWETKDATLYMSTPVVSSRWLYGMSQKRAGQMFSLDVATGKVEWKGEGKFGKNATVFDTGPMLLALATDSRLHVFKKDGAALTEVACYQVSDTPTWASPAFAGRRVLVKDKTALAMWEVPE